MQASIQRHGWRWLMCLWGCLGYASAVGAGSVQLESTPLFLTVNVKPNLLFLIDDSESMDWEVISNDIDNDGRFTGLQKDDSVKAKHRDNNADGLRLWPGVASRPRRPKFFWLCVWG